VRIAIFVGEVVVLAVVGHPLDHRALDRERSEDGEAVADHRSGLERAVREQAVKADCDAQARRRVSDCEQDEVDRLDEAPPAQHDRDREAQERQQKPDQVADLPRRRGAASGRRRMERLGDGAGTTVSRRAGRGCVDDICGS
jgi:hypothetical protein